MTERRLQKSCSKGGYCEELEKSVLKVYLNGAKHELIGFNLLEQKGKTFVGRELIK